ncbi:MAG: putative phospholipid ABC transporter-binding protein MlaD [Candidatus Erwinia impunctatus]|nr:putative phospholipid ABC transporter-binding protein MlaD [Culicoides impunctatus]
MQTKKSEVLVGIFILLALLAALFLCLRVASVQSLGNAPTWSLYANFNNIGGLKAGAPVKIGGVVIGRVSSIVLDNMTLEPRVTMEIEDQYNQLPDTSSLVINTAGLLGEQYLTLKVGFYDPDMGVSMLKDGATLQDTKSAVVLEDLIGQFLYKSNDAKTGSSDDGGEKKSDTTSPAVTH